MSRFLPFRPDEMLLQLTVRAKEILTITYVILDGLLLSYPI
jgi:hypothetical protein